jgi:hypothetical protein
MPHTWLGNSQVGQSPLHQEQLFFASPKSSSHPLLWGGSDETATVGPNQVAKSRADAAPPEANDQIGQKSQVSDTELFPAEEVRCLNDAG